MSRNEPVRAKLRHGEVVLLNPGGYMKKHRRMHRYSNPESIMKEAGKVLVATAAGAAVAVAGSMATAKVSTDARYQAATLAGGGLVLGVALHVKDFAPRVGKAVAAASVGIAGQQAAQHYELQSRITGLVSGTKTSTTSTTTTTGQGGYPAPGVRSLGAGYPAPGIRSAGYPLQGAGISSRNGR